MTSIHFKQSVGCEPVHIAPLPITINGTRVACFCVDFLTVLPVQEVQLAK